MNNQDLTKNNQGSNKGGLISREALKKALQNREECKECTDIDCIHCFYDIIDNIPAVEPDEIQAIMKDYLVYRCEPQRPKGKWIKIFENPFTNGYICSVCGHKIQVTEQFLPQVTDCEVCGAEMEGGAE